MTILEWIGLAVNIIALIIGLVIFVLYRRDSNKENKSNALGIKVLKGKKKYVKPKVKPVKVKEPEYMWDAESRALVEITPDSLAKWKDLMSNKTKKVIDGSKKGGK